MSDVISYRRRSFFILLFIIVYLCGSLSASSPIVYANSKFDSQMNSLLRSSIHLKGAVIGVSIRSASNGNIVYSHLGDTRLKPASNLKLLTAAAALESLGKEYTFSTEVLTTGKITGSKLKGSLYLKGKGDPTLLKSDLDHMAGKLKKMGIKTIEGNLVADDTWYDDVRYSMDLPWSDEQTYYGAQVSALTVSPDGDYDSGSVLIEVRPAKKVGEKAEVVMPVQSKLIQIINNTKTVASSNKKELKITRKHGSNTLVFRGSIPLNAKPSSEWVGIWNPTTYTLDLFKQSLKKNGITIKGKTEAKVTPKSAKVMIKHASMPLSKLLVPFMKLSNNGHAEILVKEMGKIKKGEGSWEKGLEVMKTELSNLGVNPNTFVLRDGSGISHINLAPANEISKLLFTIRKKEWYSTFLHSLPVAGDAEKMVGGTLRHRMKNPLYSGKIRAKTGSLSTVSSLSGYIETKSGQTFIYSILINNLLDEDQGKLVEDEIVEILFNQ